MKKNKNGFSIIFAMGMALISTLIVIYILDYMIPFAKNVKGIENSTSAYYQAISSVEDALYYITKQATDPRNESTVTMPTSSIGYAYKTFSSGSTLPSVGYGNSEYDNNWSRIRTGEPVQIQLPRSLNWANIKVFIRVPNFDLNSSTIDTIDTALSGIDLVNWQLTSKSNTLNSQSGSRFTNSQICSSTNNGNSTFCTTTGNIMRLKLGNKLDGTTQNFENFYNAECTTDYDCILKFSIINSLQGQTNGVGGKKIPYLEYKILFPINVPSNVVRINAKGKSYGFQKEFDIYSPRESLIEAYDFTVFQ